MTFKFEKRKHPRTAFQHAAILEVLNRRTFAGGRALARLVNLGAGGAAITLDAEISVGDLVRLTVRPEHEAGLVVVEAQVAWVRRNGIRLLGALTAGVQFGPGSREGVSRLLGMAGLGSGAPAPLTPQLAGKEGSP